MSRPCEAYKPKITKPTDKDAYIAETIANCNKPYENCISECKKICYAQCEPEDNFCMAACIGNFQQFELCSFAQVGNRYCTL